MADKTRTSKTKTETKTKNPRISWQVKRIIAAVVVIALVAVAGYKIQGSPRAAGTASFVLSPSSGSYKTGQTFTVTVSENSGSDQVNTVQMNLSYNASQLQFNSVTSGSSAGSPFTACPQSSGGSGSVNVACAYELNGSTSSVTGTNVVATISFTMLASSGAPSISIASGSLIVLTSSSTNDWNGTLTSATYSVVLAPTVSITAPAASSLNHISTTITASATDNSGTGLSKVEFYANGSLLATDTTSPYSYTWDTLPLTDGSYSLTAIAYDNDGNSTTSSAVPVNINNGDANGDGTINVNDLSALATNWGKASGATYAQGDFNGDGTINGIDLSIMAKNWGD